MYRLNYCEIDLNAVRHNMDVMRRYIAPGAKFMAVVKANAYGHGAAQVAWAALGHGADALAVAIPEEGEALTSITLNGNLDDSIKPGSIWVWAEGNDNTKPNHYYMLKQFAVVSFSGEISEATCKAFRNARPDADTD